MGGRVRRYRSSADQEHSLLVETGAGKLHVTYAEQGWELQNLEEQLTRAADQHILYLTMLPKNCLLYTSRCV